MKTMTGAAARAGVSAAHAQDDAAKQAIASQSILDLAMADSSPSVGWAFVPA
jgi:hypothetical protein